MKKLIFAIFLIIAINFAFSSKCTDKKAASGKELVEADCKDLETSDNNKYQCAFNALTKKCEEVSKEVSNNSKLKEGLTYAAIACCAVILCGMILKCLI